MTGADTGGTGVGTAELRSVLERALRERFGPAYRVRALGRRPSPYRSSSALEELTVCGSAGEALHLVFKDAGWSALSPAARRAKPRFLHDPERECAMYRTVLGECPGTAGCVGAVVDPARSRHWLFLEHVPGLRLADIGPGPVWHDVARWLARFHVRFAGRVDRLPGALDAHLLRYDAAYYGRWHERAAAIAPARLGNPADRERLARALDHYRRAIPRLAALPATVIHGECYAMNVLAAPGDADVRICPVDWELAAIAPGAMDLAALAAGSWTEAERTALARSYYDALPGGRPAWNAFLDAFADCRLHHAVQFLGWSRTWSPPPEQEQNWLAVATEIADRDDRRRRMAGGAGRG